MGFDYDTLESLRDPQDCWPEEAEDMYERVTVIGRGSFGLVWMARRRIPPAKEHDDEYVALKNIKIKDHKGKIFAQREISILTELHHPNVIRLIRAFPMHQSSISLTRLVAMQLAQGPDLQALIAKKGAVGLPLARLVSRHLIAAVSYLHGRGVLHRDIKPANCIIENTKLTPQDDYDWQRDDDLWSNGEGAEEKVRNKTWNLLLIDFGFARALTGKEITDSSNHLRSSIVNESSQSMMHAAKLVSKMDLEVHSDENQEVSKTTSGKQNENQATESKDTNCSGLGSDDSLRARSTRNEVLPEEYVQGTVLLTGENVTSSRRRYSGVTEIVVPLEEVAPKSSKGRRASSLFPRKSRRCSSTRVKMRSMSALGTKAFAAPEIRHDLREKEPADVAKLNEALTSCVADYGMIVDSYSVGWTLRVIITGVPPNVTISEYLHRISKQEMVVESGCCGRRMTSEKPKRIVRDTSEVPEEAASLIKALTMPKPDERMTIREAQNQPWIRGDEGEEPYVLPEGDHPSKHGDPVVPLKCAESLLNQTDFSMQYVAR